MADATVGIQELREATGRIIDRVEQGETITITRRGHLVARLLAAGDVPRLRVLPGPGIGEGYPYLPGGAKVGGVRVSAIGRVPKARR